MLYIVIQLYIVEYICALSRMVLTDFVSLNLQSESS